MGKMIDRMWERLVAMFDREGHERDCELKELIRIEKAELLIEQRQLEVEREQLSVSKQILHELQSHHNYNVIVSQTGGAASQRRNKMADNIPVGGTGTFNAVLQDNGTPVSTQPTNWTWSTNDPSAVVTPVTTDPTGATVTVSIPNGDASTAVMITATTSDPSGNAVTGNLTVQIGPGDNFTVVITKVA